MPKLQKLSDFQISALTEMGNIGSGHAAIALSQLLSRKIMVAVTKVRVTNILEFSDIIGTKDTLVISVYLKALADIRGAILLILDRDAAHKLADVLMNYKIGTVKVLDEMEQSAIKEAGSILSASYLNALSELMKITVIPSVPRMLIDKLDVVLKSVFSDILKKSEVIIGIETEFIEASTRIKGYFLFMPDQEGLEILLKTLKV